MSDKSDLHRFRNEDEKQRDFLKGQALNTKSPFEYVDMSVKKPMTQTGKSMLEPESEGRME